MPGFVTSQPADERSRIVNERRKVFFFEKKKQKTFVALGFRLSERARPRVAKVFWFFFSKKNILASISS
jgi:hypothetical protein